MTQTSSLSSNAERGLTARFDRGIVFTDSASTMVVNAGRRAYSCPQRRQLGQAHAARARELLNLCPLFASTVTAAAPTVARNAGVGAVWIKDDSARMGSGSFKALGGAYAVVRVVLAEARRRLGREVSAAELASPSVRAVAETMTVTCASAGNRGLSVAAGARVAGVRAVVWLSDRVSAVFAQRLGGLGAEVRWAGAEYTDSLAAARTAAEQDRWWLVADSSWPGYLEVLLEVMRGYTVTVAEAADWCEAANGPATHVFVQAGVGGLAAAVAGYLRDRWGEATTLVVEPHNAACLLSSARDGQLVRVAEGRTVLGRLDCGEPSLLAWQLLSRLADAFLTVPDSDAVEVAADLRGEGITVSACGATGAAGLLRAATDARLRSALGLDRSSRILLFGTEAPVLDVPVHKRSVAVTDADKGVR